VTASLRTDGGDVNIASSSTTPITGEWEKYTVTFMTAHDAPTTAKARFVLSASGIGAVLLASAELFFLIKWLGAAYLLWLFQRTMLGEVAEKNLKLRDLSAREGLPHLD
jgi:NADH:ubiquinone oxidoreductase subunit 4 (subunit M)